MDMLNDVIAAVTGTNDTLKNMIDAVQGTVNYGVGANKLRADAVAQGTNAQGETPLSIQVKEQALLEAQKSTSAVLASMGINLDGSADIRRQAAEDYKTNFLQQRQADQEVAKRSSSSLFTDPVQWIQDQLLLPSAQRKATAANDLVTHSKAALEGFNKLTNDTAVANNAAAETRSAAEVASKTEAVKNDIIAKSQEINYHTAAFNLQGIQVAASLDQHKLGNTLSEASQVNADMHLKLAVEQAQEMRKQHELEAQKLQMIIDDRAENKAATDEQLRVYNLAQAARGMPPVNIKQLKILELTPQGKQQIVTDLFTGMKISETGKNSLIAESPGLAAKILLTTPSNLPAGKKITSDFVINNLNEVSTAKTYSALDDKGNVVSKKALDLTDKATREQNLITMANATAEVKAKQGMDTADSNASTNPYSIATQPIQAILNMTGKLVSEDTFFQKIVAPQVTGGMENLNFDRLIADGIAGIKAGKVKINEVAEGISNLGAAAVYTNNAVRDYNSVGLPSQKTAKVNVTVPGVVFGKTTETIRATNATDILRVLNKVMSRQNQPDLTSVSGTNNPFNFSIK